MMEEFAVDLMSIKIGAQNVNALKDEEDQGAELSSLYWKET